MALIANESKSNGGNIIHAPSKLIQKDKATLTECDVKKEKKETDATLTAEILNEENTLYIKVLQRAHGNAQSIYITNKVVFLGSLGGRGRARKLLLETVWRKNDVTKKDIDLIVKKIHRTPH